MDAIVLSVRVIADDGQEIVAPATGYGDGGWGLATYAAGALEGWWTPPAPRTDTVERPQADGSFAPSRLLVGARVLTLVLHHHGGTSLDEREAREALAAMSRQWVRVIVEEDGRTSHVRGYVSETVKLTHVSSVQSRHTLILTCPDPLKYEGVGGTVDDLSLSWWHVSQGVWSAGAGDGGVLSPLFDQTPRDDVTTTGAPTLLFTGVQSSTLRVVNDGTMPTWPVLEVDGPVSWARWVLDDQVVGWSSPVPTGMTLRINSQDGMVTLGDVQITQAGLSRDDFFPLMPGESAISVYSDEPARMRVRWLPAWI